MIPEHTKNCIDRYVTHGYHPGSFLYAVLTNNLVQSFASADADNKRSIFHIVEYIHNVIPYNCHGNIERVEHWLACFDENGIKIREPKG